MGDQGLMRTGVLDVKRWDVVSVGGMVGVHAVLLSHLPLPLGALSGIRWRRACGCGSASKRRVLLR